ncbi:MAG: hypothetical protein ABIJ21_01390 [Nanoarchaeota archaeon]
MVKNHLKRIRAPSTWAVPRKKTKFIAKPRPGGQDRKYTLPLSVILKENLSLFSTTRELKSALQKKAVLVNQKPRTEIRFPVGLFDTISIPDLKAHYLLTITKRGKLSPLKIADKKMKIAKIVGKHTLQGKKIQLLTMDGRTFLIDKDTYAVGDTIKVELPIQKIIDHYKLEKGATVFVFKGAHTGRVAKVDEISGQTITFSEDKTVHETKKEFVIVIDDAYAELKP